MVRYIAAILDYIAADILKVHVHVYIVQLHVHILHITRDSLKFQSTVPLMVF